jgi:hypothetical protein
MIFAENGPIEKTMTSYKNHEFIPPGGKTKILICLDESTYSPTKRRKKQASQDRYEGGRRTRRRR